MDYKALHIGNLLVKKPIIQGGMGVGISLSKLAGAVAKQGGLGVISTAQIGFKEPDFYENPKEANLRAIKKEIQAAREIASDGVIGCNIMVALRDYEQHVRAAVAAGADIIISGAGLPVELPAYTSGSQTKIAPIVSSAKSAKIILRYWDKHYHTTANMVVIEGPKAGGHLGFSHKDLEHYESAASDYDLEIKNIMAVIKDYEKQYDRKIPVAVAGGIWDSKDVCHAFELGADAIQVATRFVTTEECDADIRYKEAYIHATKEDIAIVKSPVGMPGRAIMNPFMKKIMAGEKCTPKQCLACMKNCNPAEIPYCITEALIHAAKGELNQALLFCGENAWKAEKIETVEDVFKALLEEVK